MFSFLQNYIPLVQKLTYSIDRDQKKFDADSFITDKLKMVENLVVKLPDVRDEFYDYIVVGGGAAGCSLSRTLSETSKVLLVERGNTRSSSGNEESRSIHYAGKVIANPHVSQPIVTSGGVVSHIPNILGGGTSINMGISITERENYYDYMRDEHGLDINFEQMEIATDWVRDKAVTPMDQNTVYAGLLKSFAEDTYGTSRGVQSKLELNTSWEGETYFDSNKGLIRNAADVLLSDANPDNFELLVNTYAKKVVFDGNTARCVELYDVQDAMPGRVVSTAGAFVSALLAPFYKIKSASVVQKTLSGLSDNLRHYFSPLNSSRSICVKQGGKIVVSAGTLLSPTILANSGIGTTDSLAAAGVEPLVVNETIGRDMLDRALIPVGMFMSEEYDYDSDMKWTDTRVVSSIAISAGGESDICEKEAQDNPFGPAYRNNDSRCYMSTMESLGGGEIGEGVIYATRYLIPPMFRSHPLVIKFFNVIEDCDRGVAPLGLNFASKLICPHADKVVSCLRKIRAIFYFQAQPISTFDMKLERNQSSEDRYGVGAGQGLDISIDGEYMSTPNEMRAAALGVKKIVSGIQEGYFDDICEANVGGSCPKDVVIGIIGLMTAVYEALAVAFVLLKRKQNLFTNLTNSMERVSAVSDVEYAILNSKDKTVEDTQMEKVLEQWRPYVGTMFDRDVNALDHTIKRGQIDTDELANFLEVISASSSENLSQLLYAALSVSGDTNVTDEENQRLFEKADMLSENDDLLELNELRRPWSPKILRRLREQSHGPERSTLEHAVDSFHSMFNVYDDESSSARRQLEGGMPAWLKYWDIDGKDLETVASGRISTFPPNLPDVTSDRELFDYAMTYKTSIWHWIASLKASDQEMDPVTSDFAVRGVDNLYVVDASVLKVMPRMNPATTLVGLGRYAAPFVSA